MPNAASPHRKYALLATVPILCLVAVVLGLRPRAGVAAASPVPAAKTVNFQKMGAHMSITPLEPEKPGDRARAQAILEVARQGAAPYRDFHKALADGFVIQMPELDQDHYHFINAKLGAAARTTFDPAHPPALIYEKEPSRRGHETSYKLVGVMYQTGLSVSDDDLRSRVPLSIAQWHRHDDICTPPQGSGINWLGPDKKFGLGGSISTQADCLAAGGTFLPHIGGWMTHLYLFETDPARQWRTDMDHDGHDSSMAGIKM
jgi:hypothetical protein